MLATMAFAAVPPDQTSGQSGESSTVDDPQVLSLLKEANQGSAGAQFLLGFFYAEGQGVAKNEQEAIKWYTLAAEQGHADAIVTLGMMYSEGRGVKRDLQEAVRWYTQAAGQGNADVQLILAEMLAGSPKELENLQESYKWTLLAEANGRDVAGLKILLASRLTAAQIADAQKQAQAFKAEYPLSAKKTIDQTIPPGHRVEPQRIPAQPQIIVPDPNQPSSEPGVSGVDDFALQFPSTPKRTVVQNTERLTAIHYQSLSADGQIQYNASFQNFKTRTFDTAEAQKTFLEEYLVGRAMVAWKNRIQKKFIAFRGQTAAVFKHTTFSGGTETIHEGIIFIAKGNFISITCVYPVTATPKPAFDEFMNSFQILTGVPMQSDASDSR